jgi:hypothetical protein
MNPEVKATVEEYIAQESSADGDNNDDNHEDEGQTQESEPEALAS